MNPAQHQLHEKTQWLRPYTRMAASFSMRTQGWLPSVVRNLPLKIINHTIAGYQRKIGSDSGIGSGSGGCKG